MPNRNSSARHGTEVSATLFLRGPARLEHEGAPIKLRRKGLGLLYYLALEGSGRRELLADLLWGHRSAANNLRVELHRLKGALSALGCRAFEDGEDPLTLPDCIELDRSAGGGEVMEGLEDLSHEFQLWLEEQRARFGAAPPQLPVREGLVQELVGQIRRAGLPFVLILKGQPGSGRAELSKQLAASLGLPFVEGVGNGARALRHIAPPAVNRLELRDRILADRESLWVLERSAFGEDPRALLELRGSFPAERIRYVDLPLLGWSEARRQLLPHLPFSEAARLYLATGGNPGYLQELLRLRPEAGFDGELPVPQRMRAAYALEARYLSQEARFALERLSVHPGPLSDGLAEALRGAAHLDELERRGWLVFDGDWRFVDETVRRVIYDALPGGQRRRYHQAAARQLGGEGKAPAAAYHQARLQEGVAAQALLAQAEGWAQEALRARAGLAGRAPVLRQGRPGAELALFQKGGFGPGVQVREGRVDWVRRLAGEAPSGARWTLPEEPCLLQMKGRAYVDNPAGIGLSGKAAPLELEFLGRLPRQVVLAEVPSARLFSDGGLLLPLEGAFEHWLYLADYRELRASSAAEAGVVELELTAYRPSQAPGAPLRVYDLAASHTAPESGEVAPVGRH